jgi:PAS domain S-box-containing protein
MRRCLAQMAHPWFDHAGQFAGIEILTFDITQRKNAEEQLSKYHQNLQRLVDQRTAKLKQAVAQLSREIADREQAQKALAESEKKFRRVVEQSGDGIVIIDDTGTIIEVNTAQERISGMKRFEAIGAKIWDLQGRMFSRVKQNRGFQNLSKRNYIDFFKTGMGQGINNTFEAEFEMPDGSKNIIQALVFAIDLDGNRIFVSFSRDITTLRRAENELSEQNRLLQEKNIALREVMGQLEFEKKRIAETVKSNMERLVLPQLEKIKIRSQEDTQKYLHLLEENLRDITAGFGRSMSSALNKLTQKEIEICDMIKRGLSCKEIGKLQNISTRTVETHRNRIRKKLGISDATVNLATYLKNL